MLDSKKIIINHDINKDIIDFIGSDFSKVILFTQKKIQSTYYEIIKNIQSKYSAEVILLDDGENAKDINSAIQSISQLAQLSANKQTLLIGFGGGTVTDHVGFVASIFKRGIEYINVPTTLIGMIDASIGGKTALNTGHIKNQIGTFYQPSKVFIDLDMLDAMPIDIINDGLGEMFKYSILSGEKLFNKFKNYLDKKDLDTLYQLVNQCCKIKFDIVTIDECDQNIRKTLNLGHTFGHAIESESQNGVSHGIAVINGVLMEGYLALKKGFITERDFIKIESVSTSLIRRKYKINNVNNFVNFMMDDKKNSNNKIGVIMIKSIGKVELKYFTHTEIKSFIGSYNEYISD